MSGVSASPASLYPPQYTIKTSCCSSSSLVVSQLSLQPNHPQSSNLKLESHGLRRGFPKLRFQCNSSSRPGGPGSGESDTRGVLDAFFLGKALAEAINERIESTVGELLSTVGRLQAEQQKQVQEFQEDVLERAKKAKEKAAREAQGFIPLSTKITTPPATKDVTDPVISISTVADADISALSSDSTATTNDNPVNKDPLLGMLNDD